MALLAGGIFVLGYALIKVGGWTLNAWVYLLADVLSLPRSLALSLAVLLTAAVITGAAYALLGLRRASKIKA